MPREWEDWEIAAALNARRTRGAAGGRGARRAWRPTTQELGEHMKLRVMHGHQAAILELGPDLYAVGLLDRPQGNSPQTVLAGRGDQARQITLSIIDALRAGIASIAPAQQDEEDGEGRRGSRRRRRRRAEEEDSSQSPSQAEQTLALLANAGINVEDLLATVATAAPSTTLAGAVRAPWARALARSPSVSGCGCRRCQRD